MLALNGVLVIVQIAITMHTIKLLGLEKAKESCFFLLYSLVLVQKENQLQNYFREQNSGGFFRELCRTSLDLSMTWMCNPSTECIKTDERKSWNVYPKQFKETKTDKSKLSLVQVEETVSSRIRNTEIFGVIKEKKNNTCAKKSNVWNFTVAEKTLLIRKRNILATDHLLYELSKCSQRGSSYENEEK